MDELIDCLIDELSGRDRSFVAVQHAVFLHPVHHEVAYYGYKDTDWLKRHIEAHPHEKVYHIDVFVPHLKFNPLMESVMFFLGLIELAF